MFKFKLPDDPNDIRIALNVIGDGVAALALFPIVDIAFRFTEVPVRVVAFVIIMIGVAALLYFVVDQKIPVPERPVIETEEADMLISETEATVTVPKMPSYPPSVGPESAIRYRLPRHGIVLTPYVLLAVTFVGSTVMLLLGNMSVQAVNGTLLFLEIACILLILFDRRHDGRVFTVFVCALFVAAIVFVWTSQQQINVYFGQLSLVAIVVTVKFYLWQRTRVAASRKVMLYMIVTPFSSFAPSIEIKAASAPNITQTPLDMILNTCTIHLDTSAIENGRYKSLRFVKYPDEIRPLFGQPTSSELKKNARDAKLRAKALKEKRKEKRKEVQEEKRASK